MLHKLSQLVLTVIWSMYCGLNKQCHQQCLCLNTGFPIERIILRGKENYRGSILGRKPWNFTAWSHSHLFTDSFFFLGGRDKVGSPSCSNQCGVCFCCIFPAMKNSNRWNSTQTDHCFLEMISISHLLKAMTNRSTPRRNELLQLAIWKLSL